MDIDMMKNVNCRTFAANMFAAACGALVLWALPVLAKPPAGYMNFDGLSKAVHELADSNPKCALDQIGTSRQGRSLFVLTLAADPAHAGTKPALLITAGLDARHRVGTETALRVARRLLADHADLLNDTTVYVIPCVNPDGAERNAGAVDYGHIGTMRVLDEDRDGVADEDGPQDLNGDGVITMMRRLDPPLDDKATLLPDPACPRLLKTADPEKGERAIYSVYLEGLDQDGDGKIAEDGPGQVDLDRNFMHRWPEHEMDAGPYQLSEPESLALAKFVLGHANIVEAITYGRHDNLINVPDGKGKDISGEAPRELDGEDVNWYKEMSKVFKDVTGQERAPQHDTAGSFEAWLYAQRGIPSFATVVWGRPDASKPKEEKKDEAGAENKAAESKNAESKSDGHADSAPAEHAKPQAAEGEKKKDGKKKDEAKPADAEAAAWLDYSDRDRHGEGFIEWKPFDHPTLGKVEIGGFVPGFQMNPPADQLDSIAERQTAFAAELIKRQPKLSTQGPEVKKLATGLYEVRFGVVNEGYLPTATAMARKTRSMKPTVIRISVPVENIVAGERVIREWGIGGSGERMSEHWIVRVDDGSPIEIEINNPQLGKQTITFNAEEKK
jgi:hypothetical protein